MSQSKLKFRTTKHRQCSITKQIGSDVDTVIKSQDAESKKATVEETLKSKRKWVSSPDSPGPDKAPSTGHTKSKRGKRARRQNIPPSACKTLLHYMNTAEKDTKKEAAKKEDDVTPVKTPAEAPVKTPAEAPVKTPAEAPVKTPAEAPVKTPAEAPVKTPAEAPVKPPAEAPVKIPAEAPVKTPVITAKIVEAQSVELAPGLGEEQVNNVTLLPAETSNKSTQKPGVTKITAEFLLQKSLQRSSQEVVEKVKRPTKYVPKTSGGRMLAAVLNNADGKRRTPAFKSDIFKALAAKPGECLVHTKLAAKSLATSTSNTPTDITQRTEGRESIRSRGSAKSRFAHLLQPPSPKLKPFQSITISSPTKSSPSKSSPRKDIPAGLTLPESYKSLLDKFTAVDQVINIKIRRRESTTFQSLQKNVQEICRKRFTEDDLARIVGIYPSAYILRQEKGLVQVKNDRCVRGGYQLTININLTDTEDIRRSKIVNTSALHPGMSSVVRKVNFSEEESNIKKYNEEKEAQESHDIATDNQRGLISAEVIERKRRCSHSLLNHVRALHQDFLKDLVPPLYINDNKLTRWHPEFDLNGLSLPPLGPVPESPDSKKVLSASAMLHKIDSNRAQPPPGMSKAVEKQLKEKEKEKKGRPSLDGIDSALIERIRAKEAKIIAEKLQRSPVTDKELTMLSRMDSLVRCMRVIYVSAGKGSMLFDEVCSDISDSSKVPMSSHSVAEHIRLLVQVVPTWVSLHSIRKKQYLKVNRNTDINNVLNTIKSRESSLALIN